MRARLERINFKADLSEHGIDEFDISDLSEMSGADKHQLAFAKALSISRAHFDKRKHLCRLDRRLREYRLRSISRCENLPAVSIDDDRTTVHAFNKGAAQYLARELDLSSFGTLHALAGSVSCCHFDHEIAKL